VCVCVYVCVSVDACSRAGKLLKKVGHGALPFSRRTVYLSHGTVTPPLEQTNRHACMPSLSPATSCTPLLWKCRAQYAEDTCMLNMRRRIHAPHHYGSILLNMRCMFNMRRRIHGPLHYGSIVLNKLSLLNPCVHIRYISGPIRYISGQSTARHALLWICSKETRGEGYLAMTEGGLIELPLNLLQFN
jgi:hypothetical protein